MLTADGVLLVALGLVVGVACLAGRSDERLLERHVRQQRRLRGLARLRPVERDGHRRALRTALTVGVAVGAIAVAAGILVLA